MSRQRENASLKEIAEVVERCEGGQTITEISRALGRSHATVARHLNNEGGRSYRKVITEAVKARIVGLAQAGFTASEISSEVGFSRVTVWTIGKGHFERSAAVRRKRTEERRIEIAQAYAAARSPQDRKRLLAKFEISTPESLKVLACQGRKLLAAEARV